MICTQDKSCRKVILHRYVKTSVGAKAVDIIAGTQKYLQKDSQEFLHQTLYELLVEYQFLLSSWGIRRTPCFHG